MNMIQRLELWGDTHQAKWIDVIRILLGVFFLAKAAQFINSMNQLSVVMDQDQSHFLSAFLIGTMRYYTIMVHILGGFMVLFGLRTRTACILQIPILLVALAFYNSPTLVMAPDNIAWLSVLILLITIFFSVEGGGPWSADHLMKSHPRHVEDRVEGI